MYKLFIVALFAALSISNLCAQNVVVSGVVRDKANREPLPYANVLLLSGVMTDDDGRFSLEMLHRETSGCRFPILVMKRNGNRFMLVA